MFPQKTHPYGVWTSRIAQRGPGKGDAESTWREVAQNPAGRLARTAAEGEGAVVVATQLDGAQTATLFEAAHEAYNLEPDEVVLAALGSVLCEWSGDKRVMVEVVGDLREADLFGDHLDVARTVGCFATRFPFVLRTGELEWPEEAVVTTKEERRAVREEGLGWDRAAHAVAADVRFAWRGALDGGDEEVLRPEMFVTSGDGSMVVIDAFVRAGQLVVQWSHSGQAFGAETLRRQADRLGERLLELSARLESVEAGRFTPSDFDGIGEDDFAALASLLGDD